MYRLAKLANLRIQCSGCRKFMNIPDLWILPHSAVLGFSLPGSPGLKPIHQKMRHQKDGHTTQRINTLLNLRAMIDICKNVANSLIMLPKLSAHNCNAWLWSYDGIHSMTCDCAESYVW